MHPLPTSAFARWSRSASGRLVGALLFAIIASALLAPAPLAAQAAGAEREFVLQATMLGYRGMGGEIDGVTNPDLRAALGERVTITIIGGDPLPHDIALENAGIVSSVVNVDDRASITFVMEGPDTYYCTIPGHRAAGMVGSIELLTEPETELAAAAGDGATVVLDFEDGSLVGWSASGDAFGEGAVRSADAPAGAAGFQGSRWVSSGDTLSFRATGQLTSAPFPVTERYASFRVAGGALKDTRVELVHAARDSVVFEISGYDGATLRPVVVDLADQVGEEIYVRLIDEETGLSGLPYIADNRLAYIAFDDLRLYAQRPEFPNELDPAEIRILPPIDYIPEGGYTGAEAVREMEVPDGFTVTLAAEEPDVVRPIAFTMDDRGRLWVVEAMTYPVRAPEGEGRDRVLIFEDSDGDGTLDRRTVFLEGLNLVSGIEVGFGGVWLGAAPYLLYVPIDESGDRPAGEPRVVLDGWGFQDTHETLNSLRWGPDGWLYGTQGIFTYSRVGKPGTPDEERLEIDAGVWRYHPQKEEFEVFAQGGSNPWGLDFDDYGQAFMIGCVIPHLFHVVQGAYYHRQDGEHFNPFVYDDIKSHADHVHWVGEYGPHAGNNRSAAQGGGHAHAGAMVYLGGSWPEEYRNRIFTNNVHGARTNVDILERRGSGYVGSHGPDFLVANDAWSQMLSLRYGPDGSVFVIDWYDWNQCHSTDPHVHDHIRGRIYRIAHENDAWVQVDLGALSSLELVQLQLHENDWYVRHARRLLQERGPDRQVHRALRRILDEHPDVTRRLRAMWALHVTGGFDDRALTRLLEDDDEHIRSWAIQMLAEDRQVPRGALQRMARMAAEDPSARVRLYLAAAMQRLPLEQRWETLEALAARAEDADDHNLPRMVWFAAEPLATLDADRALQLGVNAQLPELLDFTVRRVAAVEGGDAVASLANALARVKDSEKRGALLAGLNEVMAGR